MAHTLVLHVGLMKSGTTFLQGRLDANREHLASQGIHFAGPNWARHAKAVTTARDLGRTVPSLWQETLKNGRTWTWDEYVDGLRTDTDAGKAFWRQQDLAAITARWAEGVGADQVTVLTVPPKGAPSELLWDRFREIAGIADATWREAPRANESLGVASALLMRRINLELADLSKPRYKKRVKALAKHTMVKRKTVEDTIGFTVPDWLRDRSTAASKQVTDLGVRVVGDLAELEPVDVEGVDPGTVTPEQELEAAIFGLGAVLRDGQKALRQPRKKKQQP